MYSPDSGGKFLQLLGYRWESGLRPDIVYPGAVCDPKRYFYGEHAGREENTSLYPVQYAWGKVQAGWTPLFSLLTRPFYLIFGMAGLHFVPWLAGLAVIELAGLLAERLRSGSGLAAAGAVGLASPMLFYSLCYWEHPLAVGLGLGAILLLLAPADSPGLRIHPVRWLGAAGLLLLASVLRQEIIFFSAAIAVAHASVHPRRLRAVTVVFAVLLAVAAAIICIRRAAHANWLAWFFPTHISDAVHKMFRVQFTELMWRSPRNIIRMLLLPPDPRLLTLLWTGMTGLALCLGSVLARAGAWRHFWSGRHSSACRRHFWRW